MELAAVSNHNQARELKETTERRMAKGEKNGIDTLYLVLPAAAGVVALKVLGFRPARRYAVTRKRLRPAQPAALRRDRAAAGTHHEAAGSDEGGREQRTAVPSGGWQMPPPAARTNCRNGTGSRADRADHNHDHWLYGRRPIGPELRRRESTATRAVAETGTDSWQLPLIFRGQCGPCFGGGSGKPTRLPQMHAGRSSRSRRVELTLPGPGA